MKKTFHKISIALSLVIALFLYGAVIVFAVPPVSQYYPSEILDPTCTPGSANCSVTTGWQFDTLNNYIYNDTDFIGIGTDTPEVALDVVGDFQQTTTLPSGATGIYRTGDTSASGGDEGFMSIIIDDLLSPVNIGLMGLDMNAGDPIFRTYVSNGTYSSSITASSFNDGIGLDTNGGASISLDADGGGDINISTDTDGDLYLTAGGTDGDINLYTEGDTIATSEGVTFIGSAGSLSLSSQDSWQGGVDADPINNISGDYQVDFSMAPYSATPAVVMEMKNNQNYALGYAALDDAGNKRYSNIYYGSLDSGNIITDIARVEAADIGTSMMFVYDTINDYRNYIDADINGAHLQTSDLSGTHTLRLETDGDLYASVLEGGATTLSVDANGHIIRAPSDEKLKTNIESLDSSLAKVMQLNPVSYSWKDPERFGDQIEIGFIAQQLEKIVPEVVRSGGEYKSVNYQILTALNAGAIKELAQQVNERAGSLIDMVKEIFVKKVTTEELCIGDVCFDEEEAEALKDIITNGGYEIDSVVDNNNEKEIDEEDEVVEESESEEVIEEVIENQEESEELPAESEEQEESEEILGESQEQEEVIEEEQNPEEEIGGGAEEEIEQAIENEEESQEEVEEVVEEIQEESTTEETPEEIIEE